MALAAGTVLFGLLLVAFVLSGGTFWLPLAVVGLFIFTAFHYVIWGWWLGRIIRADVEAEERARGTDGDRP